MIAEGPQQPGLCFLGCAFDVDGDDVGGESGKDPRFQERGFSAPAGSVDQSDAKSPVGIELGNSVSPEEDAFGNSFAIARSREEFQKEGGILAIKRTEPFGNDGNPVGGSGVTAGHLEGSSAQARSDCENGGLWFVGQIDRPLQVEPEIIGEIECGAVSVGNAWGHRLEADTFEFAWNRIVNLPQGTRFGVEFASGSIGREGAPTGEHLIHGHAEAEEIGPAVDEMSFSTKLFGAHVGNGSHHGVAFAVVFFLEGDSEIRDVGAVIDIEEDVSGLDIAMDDALEVGIVQTVSDSLQQIGGRREREGGAFQFGGEVATLDVFRDCEAAFVRGSATIVDWNDGGMVEACDDTGFREIGIDVGRSGDTRGVGDFHRDVPPEFAIICQVDPSESSIPEYSKNSIATDQSRFLRCSLVVLSGNQRGELRHRLQEVLIELLE